MKRRWSPIARPILDALMRASQQAKLFSKREGTPTNDGGTKIPTPTSAISLKSGDSAFRTCFAEG